MARLTESVVLALKSRLAALPEGRKKQLRALGQSALAVVPHRHDLTLLSVKYGGDKLMQGYIPHYQEIFAARRRERLRILEIGIGGWSDPASGGESLRMWRDFFPRSQIYGVDIADKHGLDGNRVRTFRGDQSDPEFLDSLIREIGRPDIIIDDGSHRSHHVRASFEILFPHLADDGIYAIEDLYTSYWQRAGGNWDGGRERDTSMSMLKDLIDSVHCQYIPFREPTRIDRSVVSVQVFRKLAFIFKGDNTGDDPAHVMDELAKEVRDLNAVRAGGARAS